MFVAATGVYSVWTLHVSFVGVYNKRKEKINSVFQELSMWICDLHYVGGFSFKLMTENAQSSILLQ